MVDWVRDLFDCLGIYTKLNSFKINDHFYSIKKF